MKIVLIGYMGSGKSTLGNALASHFSIPFIDLDTYIEKEQGMSIPKLFESKGAIYFRKVESQALEKLKSETGSFVLSTGGGTPCYGTNMQTMLAMTPNVVYIKLSVNALAKRLENTQSLRPLIANVSNDELPEFVGKHLFERIPYYQQASIVLETEQKNVSESVALLTTLIH